MILSLNPCIIIFAEISFNIRLPSKFADIRTNDTPQKRLVLRPKSLFHGPVRAYNIFCMNWAVFICMLRECSTYVPFIKQNIAALK